MKSNGKLIYSYRFPTSLDEELNESASFELKWPDPFPGAKEFLEYVRENTVYIAEPKKQQTRHFYIEHARKISVDYQIDMDITDYFSHIKVEIFTPYRPIWGDLKIMLATLLIMSDSVDMIPDKSNPDKLIVTFLFKIYEQYFNGKKVEP